MTLGIFGTSDNLEILIIWHLRTVIAGVGNFAFYQKKALSVKQVDLRDMFKKHLECLYINWCGIT
jgi:hypothetical protein